MKITSGRIQRAGINPNHGLSLGFAGLGQSVDYSQLTPGTPITSDSGFYVPPAGSVTDTSNPEVTSGVMQDLQAAIDAVTADQQSSLATTAASSSILPWVLGGAAVLLIFMSMGGKRR